MAACLALEQIFLVHFRCLFRPVFCLGQIPLKFPKFYRMFLLHFFEAVFRIDEVNSFCQELEHFRLGYIEPSFALLSFPLAVIYRNLLRPPPPLLALEVRSALVFPLAVG